jgi:hypothetical protein
VTTLYRAYDAADRLLYVGITSGDPQRRLGQHRSQASGWLEHARRYTYEHYADRESAAAAERSAICSEDPVWNRDRPGDRRIGYCGHERYLKWMLAYPDQHADDISDQQVQDWLDAKQRERDARLDAFWARQAAQ